MIISSAYLIAMGALPYSRFGVSKEEEEKKNRSSSMHGLVLKLLLVSTTVYYPGCSIYKGGRRVMLG